MGTRMKKKEKSDYIVQTVAHALDILEQFRGDADELGVTELSRRLKLHKNNVFRLLATLESRSYIEQNRSTENYRLGLKNLELGQTVIKQMGLHRQAMPVLQALTRDCNETSYIATLRASDVIYLDAVESAQPVRVTSRVGARLPACCTAAGKVLLAGAAGRERQDYIDAGDARSCAPRTITDRQELRKHLEMVAAQGYALEDEELDMGVRGVAAPIRDYAGCIAGAVSVSGPIMRFSEARINDELVPMVRRAAEEISMRLGYFPPANAANDA